MVTDIKDVQQCEIELVILKSICFLEFSFRIASDKNAANMSDEKMKIINRSAPEV